MADLGDLHRRLSRAIDARRGIQLSPDDLDLLAICGACKTISDAAADELLQLVLNRRPELREMANRFARPPMDEFERLEAEGKL